MGVRAHEIATARISDPSIPTLLEILSKASRCKGLATTAQELERKKRYRELMEPTISTRAKNFVETETLRLKNAVHRWRATRAASRERSLLRPTQARKLH